MRILILHNNYQHEGGEDSVVRNEAKMLRDAGHNVVVEQVSNDAISGLVSKLRTFVRVGYDPTRIAWTKDLIERVKPDVLHVHNFFPLLTTSVHETAWLCGVPVVQTLHNYRLGCAAATFERDGKVCELCLESSKLAALRYRCYRGSLWGTTALVAMQRKALKSDFLANHVDAFIALTEFAREKYVEIGLPRDKIVLKPNFVDRPDRPEVGRERSGVLFVGRLSHEKGVRDLMDAWKQMPDIPLTIIGTGPLHDWLRGHAPSNVTFLGQVDNACVQERMRQAKVLIMPSIWYEGFPVTLVEAFANGLPAVVTRIGSLSEVVEDGVNGIHCDVSSPSDICAKVRKVISDPVLNVRLSRAARDVYECKYSRSRNLEMLMACYEQVISSTRARAR